jgi:IS30 family transposase
VPVEAIRRAFHESGLSIRELARRLNVHHSSVGRVVSTQRISPQFKANAAGETVRYEARNLSMNRLRAERYLKAMGYDPKDWLPDTSVKTGKRPRTQTGENA